MWRREVVTKLILYIYFEIPFAVSIVSPHFGACNDFFDHNFFPEGYTTTLNIVELCQNENGKRQDNMFATLYDETNKIPVYSAYVLNKSNPKCPVAQRWHIEKDIPKSRQALGLNNEKYKNTGYIRGHLGLNCYPTNEGTKSVFALTNMMPEASSTHKRSFNKVQEKSKQLMGDDCIDGVPYYISGAIPGGKTTIDTDVVNIPGFLYTAACCRQEEVNGGSFSFGFIGENKKDSAVNILDVVQLGKAVKENYLLPLKEPIKFFMDDCNYKDKSRLRKLEKLVNL